jgi:hypothetical protein
VYFCKIPQNSEVRYTAPHVGMRGKVTRRAADNAQHFRPRRLLLQRLPQLVEQPGVLDGDDSLGSEVLD